MTMAAASRPPRLLAVTDRLYMPDRAGGAQWSMHALLETARAAGWSVELLARARDGSPREFAARALHQLSRGRWSGWADRPFGYPVRRAAGWHQAAQLARRVRRTDPDVVLCDELEVAHWCPRDRPLLLRVVDAGFTHRDVPLPPHPELHLLTNSRFIAGRIAERYGRSDALVLHPQVHPEQVRARRHAPHHVTFVNPVPDKGIEVAFGVAAALPTVPFLFVEGWAVPDERRAELRRRVAALPNVTLHPWTSDMRAVYARTRVLLVPSQVEEAFGRVALEAALNGIPVVASAIGGLPEAVGDGGRLLAPDAPIAHWAEAVRALVDDADAWARTSAAARAHAARPAFDPSAAGRAFVALLERVRLSASRAPRCASSSDGRSPASAAPSPAATEAPASARTPA